ncbi:MAG: hypothetical protein LBQ38_09805 [Spirochaetaceae bacterium]|jgi:hypothetical protein|nr:hypothetical protein [Spirochaetaceae bacterium]
MIKTTHFEIIFPSESEVTARVLAGFADSVYERVSGLLDIKLEGRIPVTLTPHTDEFNGYMNSLPYPHILLFDTPMSPEMTGFSDSLESLFLHELTHAISLSTRSRGLNVLHKIFGGWVYPSGLTAPQFMVEGISVSFESLDGTGRANDPLIKQKLLQAIHEEAFLSPFQAAGVYDFPPGRSAYYDYGGYFSAWLQKKYGMEKYVELWRRMGGEYRFSFFFYRNGFFRTFSDLYGIPFLTAWDDFKESLRIWTIEENTGAEVYNGVLWGAAAKKPATDLSIPAWARGGRALINGVTAGGGRVFALDRVSQRIISHEPASGETRTVVLVDGDAYDLAASVGGDRLLVSSYRYTGNMARTVVTEYDTAKGRKTGWTREGLYYGRYFRDGVVGIVSTRHINNLAFISPSGEEEILLRGSSRLLYSSPAPLDDRWIAFIASREGRREICLYNYETRDVYTLVPEPEDDAGRWTHIRGLRVSQGHLLFSYNHNGRMFKLGMVDLRNMADLHNMVDLRSPETGPLPVSPEALFSERDFSGGVFLPVLVGNEIYYRGAFTTWDALMRFPETYDTLSGIRTRLRFALWTEDLRGAAFSAPSALSSALSAALPAGAIVPSTLSSALPTAGPAEPEAVRYFGIRYINPFKLWLPLPLIRQTNTDIGISVDGGSLFSYMADPTDTNQLFLTTGFDARSLLGVFNLQWTNLSLGFPLSLTFMDDIDKTSPEMNRQTTASISASFTYGLGDRGLRLSFNTGFGLSLIAMAPEEDSSAYTWTYEPPNYMAVLGFGFSTLQRFNWELFGRGAALDINGRYLPVWNKPRVEGLFRIASEPVLPFRLSLYGVWDSNGMGIQGKSSQYLTTSFSNFTAVEYVDTPLTDLIWLGGGETEVRFFSVEIQKSLSHIYYNRVFGTLAYRGAFYDSAGASAAEGNLLGEGYRLTQSLILRLGLTVSSVFVTALPVRASISLWGAWKISNMNDDSPNNDFAFGPQFLLEM